MTQWLSGSFALPNGISCVFRKGGLGVIKLAQVILVIIALCTKLQSVNVIKPVPTKLLPQ